MNNKYTIFLPIINRWLSSSGRYDVLVDTDLEIRSALEQFARYFKNESHYDWIQYEAEEHLFHNEEYHGFVFTESAIDSMTDKHTETPTRLVGGCCFRKKEFNDGTCWVLDWIWIHPFFRHRGILTKHWNHFKSVFGEFIVQKPHSHSMSSFLEKSTRDA